LNVEIITERNAIESLQSAWNSLLIQSDADDIFLTYEWQTIWWDVYCPGRLWVVACYDDDQLVGIAPWFIAGNETLCTIGCEDVTDYLDVIVHQDHAEKVYNTLTQVLAEHADQYQRVRLCNIPAASPTLEQLKDKLSASGWSVTVEQADVCPVIHLPAEFNDYLAALDKKQRHEVRRKMRRAMGNIADVDWYTVDESHDLEEEIAEFLRLMVLSDLEKAEFLEDQKNVTFFQRLIPAMFEAGWLRLSFLTVNGDRAAVYLNFLYNNRLLIYNSGLDMENHVSLSPGIVLLTHIIQHAIEQSYDLLDFLRGDETYKYRMGGQDTSVYHFSAHLV